MNVYKESTCCEQWTVAAVHSSWLSHKAPVITWRQVKTSYGAETSYTINFTLQLKTRLIYAS